MSLVLRGFSVDPGSLYPLRFRTLVGCVKDLPFFFFLAGFLVRPHRETFWRASGPSLLRPGQPFIGPFPHPTSLDSTPRGSATHLPDSQLCLFRRLRPFLPPPGCDVLHSFRAILARLPHFLSEAHPRHDHDWPPAPRRARRCRFPNVFSIPCLSSRPILSCLGYFWFSRWLRLFTPLGPIFFSPPPQRC